MHSWFFILLIATCIFKLETHDFFKYVFMFFSLEHHNAYKKIGTTIFINFLCLISIIGQSTNIGTPFITNYLNETYQAGTQNWDIQQHPNGFMFFANNNGLLQFDGVNWTIFPLSLIHI